MPESRRAWAGPAESRLSPARARPAQCGAAAREGHRGAHNQPDASLRAWSRRKEQCTQGDGRLSETGDPSRRRRGLYAATKPRAEPRAEPRAKPRAEPRAEPRAKPRGDRRTLRTDPRQCSDHVAIALRPSPLLCPSLLLRPSPLFCPSLLLRPSPLLRLFSAVPRYSSDVKLNFSGEDVDVQVAGQQWYTPNASVALKDLDAKAKLRLWGQHDQTRDPL